MLARIARLDPRVNAFCLVDEAAALTAARASEERWARGEPCGALDGVPVSIKDLLLTRGWPTLRGSHSIDPAGPWDDDAPVGGPGARARRRARRQDDDAGARAGRASPTRRSPGSPRNPWDPTRTSGGSSGGSAAAVALGMAPLTLGTDGGGSVRIPAGFCGITALKPTWGRVPLYPASPFGTLSHVGPMTRTVADAALLLDVVSGADTRDAWALAPCRADRAGARGAASRACGSR